MSGASAQGAGVLDDRYEVVRWTVRDGLPHGEVTALALGSEGVLWIGTPGGLVRFDGSEFEPLDAASRLALLSNRVTALETGRDGSLWIALELEGIRRLRDGRMETPPGTESLKGRVRSLQEGPDGTLWVGTTAGLWADSGTGLRRLPGFEGDARTLLAVEDALFLAGPSGLWRTDGGAPVRLRKGSFLGLARAPGRVLASSRRQLLTLDTRGQLLGPPEEVSWGSGRALHMAEDGALWADLRTRRAGRFGPPHFEWEGRGQAVRAYLEDPEGNLWIGGSVGLLRVRRAPLVGFPKPKWGGSPRFLAPLGVEGDAFVVGMFGNRVQLFRDGRWSSVPGDWSATSLTAGADGRPIATGTERGVARVLSDGSLAPLSVDPEREDHAALEDSQGNLWLGRWGEVVVLERGASSLTPVEGTLAQGRVQSLFEARDGRLWVGHSQGLSLVRGRRVERIWRSSDEIPGGNVRCVFEDASGSVWVGTYGGGLFFVQGDGTLTQIGVGHGLHENVISWIGEDDGGRLVLLGNRAVSRVRAEDLLAVARGERERVWPEVFDQGPGIGAFEGNGGVHSGGWRAANGALWFPTQEGLARFDPSVLSEPLPPPQPRLTGVTVDGESYDPRFEITVPPAEGDLVFRYAPGTFVDPERARFRYRLDGYDERWVAVGRRRHAVYTKVPPGEYRFQVQSANREGTWSDAPASVALRLEPHLHERPWFRGLLALTAAFLAVAFVRARLGVAARRASELETQVAQRTAELEDARQGLERRVAERTRQLEDDLARREVLEAQLHEARRLETVGRLAGGVAHDFNNYLTVVLADAELALASLEGREAEVAEHLREIRSTGLRAAEVTRQLMAYSRRQVLKPRLVDANEVLRGLEKMLRRLVRGGASLRLELTPDLGPIRVDPVQFERALLNLVGNARDAIRATGTIVVATRASGPEDAETLERSARPGGPWTCISIRDDGRGIAPEDLEHVFEPFFTTKGDEFGTGLGLASVAGIVEQSGGVIAVSSELERGTTFELFFPSLEGSKAPGPAAAEGGDSEAAARILVCDDQAPVRSMLELMLGSLGHEVHSYASPEDLLAGEPARRGEFDLLVTDVMMPGIDGRALAGRLESLHPARPVLFITGYPLPEGEPLPRQSQVLAKPFGREQLRQSVSALMGAADGDRDLSDDSE